MTEMVYGAVPVREGEPIVPKWWRTVDRWALSCVLMLFAVAAYLVFVGAMQVLNPAYLFGGRDTAVPGLAGVLLGTVRACTSGQKRFSGLTCEYAKRGAAACND